VVYALHPTARDVVTQAPLARRYDFCKIEIVPSHAPLIGPLRTAMDSVSLEYTEIESTNW
jgi:hypothetical protein